MEVSQYEVAPEVENYRAVSPLAVIALLVALASLLTVLVPMLWFIPVLGVGLSMLAIRSIHLHPQELVGTKAAYAALFLSGMLVVWPPAQESLYSWWLRDRAITYARSWMEMVAEGDPESAFVYLREAGSRNVPGEGPTGPTSTELFERIFKKDPLKTVLAHDGQLYFTGETRTARLSYRDQVEVVFEYRYRSGPGEVVQPVVVVMERMYSKIRGKYVWNVDDVKSK